MKRVLNLNIGGILSAGDVVGVAYNNCVVFGWFVEPGQYGSLKYIPLSVPENVKGQYDVFISAPPSNASNQAWLQKKYAKGLDFKHMNKDFITSWSAFNNRAFKISNPEEFFKGSENGPQHLKGREILNNLKFPAK